jgi:aldehyde:ferredoxin oxidoreductase
MHVEFLNNVTGFDFSKEEALEVCERIVNLLRMFSIRNGLKTEDDCFSPRLGTAPTEGLGAGKTLLPYIKDILKKYYHLMGWNEETNHPLTQTLKKLALEHTICELEQS